MKKKEFAGTIDVSPKWADLVLLFVEWIQSGVPSQRQTAIDHIKQIAELADILKAHKDHGGLSCSCGLLLELDKP